MSRHVVAAGLLAGLTWHLGTARAQEQVYYLDPDSRLEAKNPVVGKITKESPAGVTVVAGKDTKVVAALDVTQVTYATKNASALEFRKPDGKATTALKKAKAKDRIDGLREAIEGFKDLSAKVRDNPFAARYTE